MKVDRPMIMMVTRKVYLRPIRSPSRPKNSAPNGRTAKPAAKAISAKMKAGGRVDAREELRGDDRRQRAVEIEVVPLEDGAERGGEDDLLLLPGHRAVGGCSAVAVYAMVISSRCSCPADPAARRNPLVRSCRKAAASIPHIGRGRAAHGAHAPAA